MPHPVYMYITYKTMKLFFRGAQ